MVGRIESVSGIDADAAVVPALLARSKAESGGKRRDPPRGKGGDHQPITKDFHHSQLGFPRDESRERRNKKFEGNGIRVMNG